jgi:hypothetical protein
MSASCKSGVHCSRGSIEHVNSRRRRISDSKA